MRTSSLIPALAIAAGLAQVPGTASADGGHIRFVGMHPIAADYGGGFCYIEFPHVHVYEPTRADVLYRPHDDGHFFVGDPTPYGYEGPKHAYYGHHPIQVDYVVGEDGDDTEYCYLEGPHYHPFLPPPQASFKLKGGVYFFAGDLPRVYVEQRPRFAKINAVYKPLRYQRPVVVVSPPPEYRGPVLVEEPTYVAPAPRATVVAGGGAGMHAEAGVGFHAGVSIGLPSVTIGAPAVVVRDEPDVIVVRDHRPRTVVVHEHHPRTIYVRDRHPTRVVRVKEHRDHGNHKGHHKGKWKW
jgi:hypothetical protein